MELQQLQYFRAVARTENMSRAAQELFITQPNLSRSITRLEQELGVPLFHRRKGKIELTDGGRQFLRHVGRALDTLELGRQELVSQHGIAIQRLAIGCMLDDTEWLKAFITRHRQISLQQYRGNLPELTNLLLEKVVDLAVTVLAPQNERLSFEKLYESEYVIIMSQSHPLTAKVVLDIEDLDQVPFILDDTRVNKQIFGRICKNFGVTFHVTHEVHHVDLIYTLVDQNLGVSMLPIIHYAGMMERMPNLKLTYRRVRTRGFPRPFWGIAFRKDYQFTDAAMLCRDFFRAYMEQEAEVLRRLPGWTP